MPSEHATRLRDAGLRATPGRIALLTAIEGAGAPLTHTELAAHPDLGGVDPITLYRALDAFARAGLVHRVQGLDGVWRSCAQPRAQAGCPGNHPHFHCLRCGRLTCLTDQPLPRVSVPPGAQVEGRQLVVYGACATCGGAAAAPTGRGAQDTSSEG